MIRSLSAFTRKFRVTDASNILGDRLLLSIFRSPTKIKTVLDVKVFVDFCWRSKDEANDVDI